jgi:hypothetical protein
MQQYYISYYNITSQPIALAITTTYRNKFTANIMFQKPCTKELAHLVHVGFFYKHNIVNPIIVSRLFDLKYAQGPFALVFTCFRLVPDVVHLEAVSLQDVSSAAASYLSQKSRRFGIFIDLGKMLCGRMYMSLPLGTRIHMVANKQVGIVNALKEWVVILHSQ